MSGTIYAAPDGPYPIYVSTNGTSFDSSLAHGGLNTSGVLVHASNGRIFRMTDGAGRTASLDTPDTWTDCLDLSYGVPTSMFHHNGVWHLFSVAYQRCTDGVTFVDSGPVGTFFGPAARVGDTFVSITSSASTLVRSINSGDTWSAPYAMDGVSDADMIIATNDNFVLFPYNPATILRSVTGEAGTWTAAANPATHNINDAAYGNGLIVGVSNGGQTVVSFNTGISYILGGNVPRYGGGTGGGQDVQNNKLIFCEALGKFFFATTSAFHVQSIYSTVDGQVWEEVFNMTSANTIDSLAEVSIFPPAPVESDLPTSKYAYIYDLGDEINGQKTFQHLVTIDTPAVKIADARVTDYGLTIKCANTLYCLPLPGEVSDGAYNRAKKLTYIWKSKKFVFPGRMTMAAAKVTKDCGGTLTMRIYVDCRLAYETEVCDCKPFRLPVEVDGIEYEIELEGTAHVTEVHIASSMKELIESE